MSKVLCEREDLVAIADAIRSKTGETTAMGLSEMSGKINGIESGGGSGSGDTALETCTVTLSHGNDRYNTTGLLDIVAYSAVEDNKLVINKLYDTENPITLTNVAKNTILLLGPAVSGMYNATGGVTEVAAGIGTIVLGIVGNGTYHSWMCFAKGTKISLANGDVKDIQDITYDDDLLVWDFDNGCYASSKPLWIKKAEIADCYYRCVFENGNTLDLVGSNGNCHRLFSLDDNRFEYANKCVGKRIMTKDGITKLLSCESITNTVEFYNIMTNYHINCYANNALTSTGLNNIYPIENMTFIKENRAIIPYESFDGIPKEYYYGLRLGENKIENIDWIKENLKIKLQKTFINLKQ